MTRPIERLRAEEPWNSRNVDTWKERVTDQINQNTSRIKTSFVGLYDQVADDTDPNTPGNQNLTAATNYTRGDFFTLSVTGAFTSTLPELVGKSGAPGDQIISDGTQWLLLEYSGAFLSSVADDTAAGVITFTPAPKSNTAASVGVDLTRKQEVDAANAAQDAAIGAVDVKVDAHIADGTVHYAQSAIDHAVIQNRGTNTHAQIDTHIANALIHFDDVPVDGVAYSRQDRLWVQAPKTPSFAYLADGGISGAWNTTLKTITGYSVANSTLDMTGFLNPSAGYIEIPTTGVWEVQATVTGNQGNNTKEEAMRLWAQYRDGPSGSLDAVLDVFDVATDKTTDRTFAFSYKRPLQAGDRIYLAVNATAGMGTFSFDITSLEVTSVLT